MQSLERIASVIGRRMGSFTQNSANLKRAREDRGVNRWALYKQLCLAKSVFRLNDRSLAVLSSLLSFLPEDEISAKNGLIVFPSNRQLSLRAHGMPESTLRRHLAALVEAGFIERKDSPTRKRYAHKDKDGSIELAFGFSFAPLLARAEEISAAAETLINEQKRLKRLRDELSVCRREITMRFETIPAEARSHTLQALFSRFRSIVDAIPRRASAADLAAIRAELDALCHELDNYLNNNENVQFLSGNAAQNERQHNESLTESHIESEKEKSIDLKDPYPGSSQQQENQMPRPAMSEIPLDMVLRTCPDICDYAPKGIHSWRDLIKASAIVSRFLGITKSAYLEASQVMGAERLSSLIAWILQKSASIQSPGGYLRALTEKVREGKFTFTSPFMALLSANNICLQH